MAKKKGVSSKTHTKKQLNDYANQHNPNNKAYRANEANKKAMSDLNKKYDIGILEGESYGWVDDQLLKEEALESIFWCFFLPYNQK